MSHSYKNMGHHSFGNAKGCGCGSARSDYSGPSGCMSGDSACTFAAPPPRRNYCSPAPFTRCNGQTYNTLSSAYGSSIPARY